MPHQFEIRMVRPDGLPGEVFKVDTVNQILPRMESIEMMYRDDPPGPVPSAQIWRMDTDPPRTLNRAELSEFGFDILGEEELGPA